MNNHTTFSKPCASGQINTGPTLYAFQWAIVVYNLDPTLDQCRNAIWVVGYFELCCRVSVLGLYGSMCRKQQIGWSRLRRWSCLSGNHLQCVGSCSTFVWSMNSWSWRRLVHWLGVVQLLALFCLESFVRIVWELIIISLLCHQLVRIVLTLFLSVHSFMLLHANGTNWVSISGHQILIVSGRVLKQCYLHNNMDADCKCIYYCYLWCDHCWLL